MAGTVINYLNWVFFCFDSDFMNGDCFETGYELSVFKVNYAVIVFHKVRTKKSVDLCRDHIYRLEMDYCRRAG